MSDVRDFYTRNSKWLLLLLLPLCYVLFFHRLGDRDLWSPDEDEYVQVNREMVLDGHWFYPTLYGEPYSIKPPLFNWLGSAVSVMYGEVNELTSRLPSAIAATACLYVLYWLGQMLFGARAAVFTVLVLATSPLYIEFARWIQINMISTLCLTLTLACFYWGYTNRERRRTAYLLMYAAAGLGTLDMGLVNAAMPAIVIAFYLLAVRDWKHVFQLEIVRGPLVYLAIVAPWYGAVALKGGYAQNLIVTTNFTRFFGEFAHARPFYYYLGSTPPYFLPWLLFLPGALYLSLTGRSAQDRSKLLLPLVWAAGLFVFFSLSNTKRSEYVLPVFPALALLVGYGLDQVLRRWEDVELRARLFTWPAWILAVAAAVAAPITAIVAWTFSTAWLLIVLPISFLLATGAAGLFGLVRRGRAEPAVAWIALIAAAVVGYGAGPYVAKRNEDESAKPFCLEIVRYLNPGEKLKVFRFYKPMYGVYTERFLEPAGDVEQLVEWFESDEPVHVVTKESEYLKLKDSFPLPIHVLHRDRVDHRQVLLLSNRPADDGGATVSGAAPRGSG